MVNDVGNAGTKVIPNAVKGRYATLVFDGVMKQGGYRLIFQAFDTVGRACKFSVFK